MSQHRSLVQFNENLRDLLKEVMDVGYDDLPELAEKLRGMRQEIDQLEQRALSIADETAERMDEPPDSGWTEAFNRGQAS